MGQGARPETQPHEEKGDSMSANNPLPKRLEKMTRQPQLPLGSQMFALLRQWYPYAPWPIRGSSDSRELAFLKWLLKGRVVDVLLTLEASELSVDRRIAGLLRDYGRKTCPHGPYPAQPITMLLFGWIGIEMGNPTWGRHENKVFIELPTVRLLETYTRMLGGRHEQMEFFPGGVCIAENLTDEQMEAIAAISRDHGLHGHCLFGGGSIVYSTDRPQPGPPQPPVGPHGQQLEELRQKSERLLIEAMIATGADFTEHPLDEDIHRAIAEQIACEDAQPVERVGRHD